MPVRKRSITRRELTAPMFMELISGPCRRPAFRDEAERRAMYFAHRDELAIDPRTGEPWAAYLRPLWGEAVYEMGGPPHPEIAELRVATRQDDSPPARFASWREYWGLFTNEGSHHACSA